jgi:hypothetical protein
MVEFRIKEMLVIVLVMTVYQAYQANLLSLQKPADFEVHHQGSQNKLQQLGQA